MSTISASTTTTTAYKVTADTTGTLVLQTGSSPTTAMTIDTSQNVGIGTASPAGRLDSYGDSTNPAGIFRRGGAYGNIESSDAGRSNRWTLGRDNASTGNFVVAYNDATKVSMDTSGNVGIGATPASFATAKALQLNTTGAIFSFTNELDVAQNVYYNAGNKYITTAAASLYSQSGGVHYWYNAPSGTAGNAITFTQAMTLDASGNLLVGTTTANTKFVVGATTQTGAEISAYTTNANGGDSSKFSFWRNYTVGSSAAYRAAYVSNINIDDSYSSANSQALGFFTKSGTSEPAERARISSLGYFKASNSGSYINAAGDYHEFVTNGTNTTLYVASTNAAPYGLDISYRSADPNGTGNQFIYCEGNAGTLRMSVRSNGGIANYSANNVNLSDSREKTNANPAGDYLAKICAIPVRTYNYIDQNLEEDDGLTLGVFAQDVQAVAPELVTESNWAGKDEEPKMRLSIYQTDLQYALMKCIQEQQAIINTLTERIELLEAK